jgi:hypothetical protein
MDLLCRDEFARYRIACPPGVTVNRNYHGTDFLVVPDSADPNQPFWLWDDLLLAAAENEEFGLRLLAVEPFN